METIYWTCGGVANMINIISVKLNSFFLGSHNSQEVTLPGKSQFQGSNIFWEVAFLGKSLALYWQTHASHAFQQDPWRSNLLGSQISREVTFQKKLTFPGKSYFPGSHIYFEKTFPGKSNFQEVTYPRNSHYTQKLTSSQKFISSRNFTFSQKITSEN